MRAARNHGDGSRQVEGSLKQNQQGRWEIHGVELTSGGRIEVLSDQGWKSGYVEHDGRQYVFFDPHGDAYACLVEGLQARIRVTFH